MNCTSCRYSVIDSGDDGPVLLCHRHPPQVIALDGEAAQAWPNVGPDDWCGEYAVASVASDAEPFGVF